MLKRVYLIFFKHKSNLELYMLNIFYWECQFQIFLKLCITVNNGNYFHSWVTNWLSRQFAKNKNLNKVNTFQPHYIAFHQDNFEEFTVLLSMGSRARPPGIITQLFHIYLNNCLTSVGFSFLNRRGVTVPTSQSVVKLKSLFVKSLE